MAKRRVCCWLCSSCWAARRPPNNSRRAMSIRAGSRGRVQGNRRAEPPVHHVFRHRLQRPGRPDVRERGQHRLAAQRDGQLHADHQLGNRDEQGNVRPQARQQPRVVEVRPGLGRRHADAEEPAADAHRQRPICLAHRRRRPAGRRAARARRDATSSTSG